MSRHLFCLVLLISSPLAAQSVAPVPTFSEHVAPLVFTSCTPCHRPGEAAPFPLLDYADVKKRARTALKVVEKRYMPPWHPEPGFGEFRDCRRLADDDIAMLRRWVEGGMPEGDPKKLPPLPQFPEGWQLGKPDLVLEMPAAFEVPARGPDIYRQFVIPLELDADQWVTAIEVRPAARTVLHHVLFFTDDTGEARRLDGQDGKPGFRQMGFRGNPLGGWAVGAQPAHLPDGLARRLPKGTDLVLSSHFHLSGKVEREKTKVGIYLAKQPPKRTLLGIMLPPVYGRTAGLDVPAGAKDFRIQDSFTLPCDVELIGVGGHAHYICTQMLATAKLPQGEQQSLFYIKDWDFNWQGRYVYKEAVKLPKGTVIDAQITYDNSAQNPRNPHSPPKRVRWGPQSTDEMGAVIFECVLADEKDVALFRQKTIEHLARAGRGELDRARERGQGGRLGNQMAERIRQLDANKDGVVEESEVPEQMRQWIPLFDRNGDGKIDAKEIESLERRRGGEDKAKDGAGKEGEAEEKEAEKPRGKRRG